MMMKVLLMVLLLSVWIESKQYLRNSAFQQPGCVLNYPPADLSPANIYCDQTVLSDNSWYARRFGTTTERYVRIMNQKVITGIDTDPADNVALLTYQQIDNSYTKVCLIQRIPTLQVGQYDITFDSVAPNAPSSRLMGAWIFTQERHLYRFKFFYTSSGAQSSFSNTFSINQELTNAYFLICGIFGNFNYGVKNVRLSRPGDISNCATQAFVNNVIVCLSCKIGFVLQNQGSSTTCVQVVEYCSEYKNGLCSICIQNYFLMNNTCIQQSAECVQTDSSGKCIQCTEGYNVKEGLCSKITVLLVCTDDQYRNLDGVCVQGTVANCGNYDPLSGQCLNCKQNFIFNQSLQCIPQTITCPQNTQTLKYFVQNGVCVSTDINCAEPNADGSCPQCNDGFYSFSGNCYSIQSLSDQIKQTLSPSNTQSTQSENISILQDENSFSYVQNDDGSRIYLTGPWKGQQVWSDINGYLYQKVRDGGRLYLTGPWQNNVAFQDINGNWFIINFEGKRIFI